MSFVAILPKEYEIVYTVLETPTDLKLDFVKARLSDEEINLKETKMH